MEASATLYNSVTGYAIIPNLYLGLSTVNQAYCVFGITIGEVFQPQTNMIWAARFYAVA